ADCYVSTDGCLFYDSNLGKKNDLTVFSVNQESVRLKEARKTSVKGEGPRIFVITPSGKYLLVANQKSNEIVVFERNLQDGKLIDTGKRIAVSQPVCLLMR